MADTETEKIIAECRTIIAGLGTKQKAIEEMILWGSEKGRLGQVETALKLLEGEIRRVPITMDERLKAVRAQSTDFRGRYRGIFASDEEARAFGLFCMSRLPDDSNHYGLRAQEILRRDHGVIFEQANQLADEAARKAAGLSAQARDMAAGDGSGVAGLVPIQLSTRVKRLIESYGVADRVAFHMPMDSDQMSYNRQTGEVSVWITGEGQPPTETDMAFGLVNLFAKEWCTLTYYAISLSDDMIVAIGELIARSIAWAYAYWTDKAIFAGDGTSAYLNYVGIPNKMLNVTGAASPVKSAGVYQSANSTWGTLTKSDILYLMGSLPQYADNDYSGFEGDAGLLGVGAPSANFFCHRAFFFQVMMNLVLAEGGVQAQEIQGKRTMTWLGAPIIISQILPSQTATSSLPLLYGDGGMTVTIGDRAAMGILSSPIPRMTQRQMTVLGTMRRALTVDSPGTASIIGPMVALQLAA